MMFVFLIFLCLSLENVDSGRFFVNFATSKCELSKGQLCIEIRKCPFFEELLDKSPKPRPRSVIKVIREQQCGFIRDIPYVCCNISSDNGGGVINKAPQLEREDREESMPLFDNPIDVVHENLKLLRNDICGPILTNSRITSGKKTLLQEFPWMALIAYDTSNGVDFRCGGTVINDRYVLTAAHCIKNSSIFGVRLGEHNLDTTEDCDPETNHCAPPTQDFYIENFIIHPDYDSKTFVNDIALIRLATPVNFNVSNVKPICLPLTDLDLNGKSVTVSGWGVTESGFKSSELLKVSIPVVPISECQRNYKHFAPINSNQICAGGSKGKDSCGGDSGGPMKYVGLVDGHSPRFIQYGIVSYGPRHCGTEGRPGIYTKVSRYLEWILDNLKPNDETEVD